MDPTDGTTTGADGVTRCWWCGDDPLYVAYHDREWGKPLRDERALFELLCLEGFQAGLSWITILRKRVAFREAFDGFDPDGRRALRASATSSGCSPTRHRAPPRQDHRHHRQRPGGRGDAGGGHLAQADRVVARAVARDAPLAERERDPGPDAPSRPSWRGQLRKWGMRFVGPTTVYAFMQSAGLVDDHLAGLPPRGPWHGQVLRKAPRPRAPIPGPVKRPKRSKPAGER